VLLFPGGVRETIPASEIDKYKLMWLGGAGFLVLSPNSISLLFLSVVLGVGGGVWVWVCACVCVYVCVCT
jgi:hypothetical protein